MNVALREAPRLSTKNIPWPVEHEKFLLDLMASGQSGSKIASAINGAFQTVYTRSSIIGKIHRLGLTLNAGGYIPPMDGLPRRRNRRKYQVRLGMPSIPDQEIPAAQRKSLDQLRENDCRWPVGEPEAEDFFFCAAVKVKGFPYCECHVARAYEWKRRSKGRTNANSHSAFSAVNE